MFVCLVCHPLGGVSESLVRQHLGLFLFIMQRMQRITYCFNVRIGQIIEIIQLCLNSSNELFFSRAGRFLFHFLKNLIEFPRIFFRLTSYYK